MLSRHSLFQRVNFHTSMIIKRQKDKEENKLIKKKEPMAKGGSSQNDSRRTANRIGSPCFSDIRYSEVFIDKTLLIEALFTMPEKIFLITAPPRFGKSVNMDMIREFVEFKNCCDVSKSFFAGTNIAEKSDIIQMHFQKYPVIHLNLAGIPRDYESAFCEFWEKVLALYRAHDYLRCSPRLSDTDKEYYSSWFDKQEKPWNVKEARLQNSLFFLSTLLKKHYNMDTIILIDEIDSPVMNAMFSVTSGNELLEIAKLRDTILGNVLKNFAGEPTYRLAILTGVADVACAITSPFRSLSRFPFLQQEDLFPYYGVLNSEFENITRHLSDKERCSLKDMYDGYSYYGNKIYNTYSLTKAIMKKKLAHYWIEEATIISKFKSLLSNDDFSNTIKDLIIKKEVKCNIKLSTVFDPEQLFEMAKCFEDTSELELDVALLFLYQHGYLTASDESLNLLKVPNNEICAALEQLYYSFFKKGNKKLSSEINEAALCFPQLQHWNEKEFEINTFRKAVEKIIRHYRFTINHQVIHSFLFMIMLKTSIRWEILDIECPIEDVLGIECPLEKYYVGSKRTRYNIVSYWNKIILIIEIKYNVSVKEECAGIDEKSYFDIIKNSKIFQTHQNNDIEYYFSMSIYVSEQKYVSTKLVIKDTDLKILKEIRGQTQPIFSM